MSEGLALMNGLIGARLRRWLSGSSRAAEGEAAAETRGQPEPLGPDGSSGSADNGPGQRDPANAVVVTSDSASETAEQSKEKENSKEAPSLIAARGN